MEEKFKKGHERLNLLRCILVNWLIMYIFKYIYTHNLQFYCQEQNIKIILRLVKNQLSVKADLHLCINFLLRIVFELEELVIFPAFFTWVSWPALVVLACKVFFLSNDFLPPGKFCVILNPNYFSLVVFKVCWVRILSLSGLLLFALLRLFPLNL